MASIFSIHFCSNILQHLAHSNFGFRVKVISDTMWQVHDGTGVTGFTFVLLIIGVIGLVSVLFRKKFRG